MIHKEALPEAGRVRVTFDFPNSVWAASVALVGEFNNWDRQRDMMRQVDSEWTITLELPADKRYEFRYLIDGKDWCTDWQADGQITNEYGTHNSVLLT